MTMTTSNNSAVVPMTPDPVSFQNDLRGTSPETRKAHARRLREGWYDQYCPRDAHGIDIGSGPFPIHDTYRGWDFIFGDTDATLMAGVPDNEYDVCFSGHTIEHLNDPIEAIRNWYRITKPGGHLIINAPHRMLYEKSDKLPSKYNGDHKFFVLPDIGEPPHTRGLRQMILEAIPDADIIYIKTLDEGFQSNGMNQHSAGEYSIEGIVKKKL